MKQWISIAFAMLLAACNTTPSQPTGLSGWTAMYGNAVSAPDFTFPSDGSTTGGVHYVVEPPPPGMAVGKTMKMQFTIGGSGVLAPNDPADLPANVSTISMLLWQQGDNLSCSGAYSQYRLFGGRTAFTVPGTYSISVPLQAANWPGCYAAASSASIFQAMLNQLYAVGFTFGGGSFAGHGLYAKSGTVTFTLNSFAVQ